MEKITNLTALCNGEEAAIEQFLQIENDTTAIIRTCPRICFPGYEDGTPDMWGLGVLISYFIQFFLTFIFSCPLVLAFHLSSDVGRCYLRAVLHRFCFANALYTLSVLTATNIRGSQQLRYLESHVLGSLAYTEVCITSGLVATSDYMIPELPLPLRNFLRCRIKSWRSSQNERTLNQSRNTSFTTKLDLNTRTGYLILLNSLLFVSFSCGHSRKATLPFEDSALGLEQELATLPRLIGNGCNTYESQYPFTSGNYNAVINTAYTTNTSIFMIIIAICYVFSYTRFWITIWIPVILPIAGLITSSTAIMAFSYYVLRRRIMLSSALGQDFRDNNLDFGQILALFAWIPSILDLLEWTITVIRKREADRRDAKEKRKSAR
ncbi:hypothetical protein F5B20DRAFT_276900 [Whalleya microplaca]|nr:hypothetical protein F5B20DRAFT_276900 [Whalleya microplaca]